MEIDLLALIMIYAVGWYFGYLLMRIYIDDEPFSSYDPEGRMKSVVLFCMWPIFLLIVILVYSIAGIYYLFLKIKK